MASATGTRLTNGTFDGMVRLRWCRSSGGVSLSLLSRIHLDLSPPVVLGDVLTVANDVVCDFRVPIRERVWIGAAHDAIHALMNDRGEIFQRRRRVFLSDSRHAFYSVISRILKGG